MRVWIINVGEEVPSDTGTPRLLRAGIIAEHMARRGHEVVWWNSTVNHHMNVQRADRSVKWAMPQGYELYLLRGTLYARDFSPLRLLSQYQSAREFARLAPNQPQPDVILVGYPTIELAEAAVRYAKARNIPVAVDFRDMWPDIIGDVLPPLFRLPAAPILAYWRRSQRFIVANATNIVGVTDGFVDWALASTGRKRQSLDRAFHLAINPSPIGADALSRAEAYWDAQGVRTSHETIFGAYTGAFSTRHDLLTVIDGVKRLAPEQAARLRLVICGRGELSDAITAAAHGHTSIMVPGWRNAAEVRVLLQRCAFGLFPNRSSKDFICHFPNKIGEYMSAGLPVMTSISGQVRDLLTQQDLGYFFTEGDSGSVACCLQEILAAQSRREYQRAQALSVFRNMFDGTRIYPAYCDYLEELAASSEKVH